MNSKRYSTIFLSALLCFVVMYSCDSVPEQKTIELNSESRSPLIKLATQSEFLPGFWMSDSYLKKVEKSKSIYANRYHSSAFFGFIIGKPNQEIDSFLLKSFPKTEMDFDSYLEFDRQKNVFKGLTNMEGKKEKFELYPLTEEMIKMYFSTIKVTDDYRKVLDEKTELRRVLFEGTYFSKDKKFSYQFDRNGKVKGLGEYEYFEVIYDFSKGVGYDAILLYRSSEIGANSDGDLFKFEFKKGVLTLTYVEADWILEKHRITDTTITMIKI